MSVALGAWLMAAPPVLGYAGAAEISDRNVGPIASSFVVAGRLRRSLRWIGLVAGAWFVVAPWILGYGMVALVDSAAVGVALAGLALLGWKVLLEIEIKERR